MGKVSCLEWRKIKPPLTNFSVHGKSNSFTRPKSSPVTIFRPAWVTHAQLTSALSAFRGQIPMTSSPRMLFQKEIKKRMLDHKTFLLLQSILIENCSLQASLLPLNPTMEPITAMHLCCVTPKPALTTHPEVYLLWNYSPHSAAAACVALALPVLVSPYITAHRAFYNDVLLPWGCGMNECSFGAEHFSEELFSP